MDRASVLAAARQDSGGSRLLRRLHMRMLLLRITYEDGDWCTQARRPARAFQALSKLLR